MAYTARPSKPLNFGAFAENVDEFQRLRRLVAKDIDELLDEWGQWHGSYEAVRGHGHVSTGFVGGGYSLHFEDLLDKTSISLAEGTDRIIDEMRRLPHLANPVLAITIVYVASVFRFNRLNLEEQFLIGVAEFERRVAASGLLLQVGA